MRGSELSEISEALLNAFSVQEFDLLLLKMDYDRKRYIGADAPVEIFIQVLQAFDRQGRLADLIDKIHRERPRNAEVETVCRKYGQALIAEFRTHADNPKVRAAYAKAGMSPEGFPEEAQLGQLERVIRNRLGFINMADWVQKAARVEGQVCLITVAEQGVGTGFLVGPDLVLTNHHVLAPVIAGQNPPAAVRCRFDFKMVGGSVALPGIDIPLANDWLVDQSGSTEAEKLGQPDQALPNPDQLDYALVRLAETIGQQKIGPSNNGGPVRGWIELPANEPQFEPHAPLYIVQHPQARPLKLAIDTDAVIGPNANRTRVRYTTNTENGSSGSPVFNERWELVALHHYGDPQYDHPKYNQGVPVSAIRSLLAAHNRLSALTAPPRAAGPSLAAQERQISVVTSGFDAAAKLLTDPEVKLIVVKFRAHFETTSVRVTHLGKYKALHDRLHNLQLKFLGVLADAVEQFRAAQSHVLLELYSFQIRQLARDARSDAEGLPNFAEEEQWIANLEQAADKIDKARQDQNVALLKRALFDLRSAIAEAPRINSLLANAAAGLGLEKLIEAMAETAQKIDPGGTNQATSVQRVREGLEGLRGLQQQLAVLVLEHFAWQWLDKEINATATLPGFTPEERFPRWTDLRSRLMHLCALSAKQDWAMLLTRLLQDLELAGAAGDQNTFDQKIIMFRTIARDRFIAVDTELLRLTSQLARVGESLDQLLRLATND